MPRLWGGETGRSPTNRRRWGSGLSAIARTHLVARSPAEWRAFSVFGSGRRVGVSLLLLMS